MLETQKYCVHYIIVSLNNFRTVYVVYDYSFGICQTIFTYSIFNTLKILVFVIFQAKCLSFSGPIFFNVRISCFSAVWLIIFRLWTNYLNMVSHDLKDTNEDNHLHLLQ